MIAKLYGDGGRLLAELPGVPDGTRELIVSDGILGLATRTGQVVALLGVQGRRLLLREGTVDTFDLAPET